MSLARSSFPDTLADLSTEVLLEAYARGPERLRQVTRGLDEADFRARPRPGKWNAHEILVHVADSEIMGSARIRQTTAQSAVEFAHYDQDVWCRQLVYAELDRDVALDLFAALRRATLPIFEAATPEDWRKTGIHYEMGPVTLRHLLELYADHGERHALQIEAIRNAAGKASGLVPLLPRPLY